MEKLDQLKEKVREITYLGRAAAVLGWDQQTYMPSGGAEDRGNQLAVLGSLTHRMFTSPEMGQLIEDCKPIVASMDPDSDDACLVRMLDKNYKKNTRVPTEHVAEFAQVTTLAQETWARARAASDFAAFRPYLERIVELRRQYASFFAPYDHVYDPLLDDFEPGLKTGDVQAIFGALRPQQVEIIQAITARPQVDDAFLHRTYPEQGQWDFGVDVITRFGYDWNRGRQDKSAHPFTTSFGIGDVRITTRFDPERSASALFSTMHECGHALYEQGIDPILAGLPLADGASMAIHESQSRMWENLVGRSLPFWTFFFPLFKERFPAQLEGVDLQTFYRGINKVEPSLIRVEADEATYNLHIMLRLELEIALMEGSLEVKDLPDAWNTRMKEYLGIVPPKDSVGVLQDVHWSGGMIGYFPTYALGNLVSVQLWECIHKDIPDLDEQIARGEFSALLGWLRDKVHRHGSKFEPQDLVRQITGTGIDPNPYVRYLKSKYSYIYGF
ncbi:MAG TPA: carboxypeptidase M32 [Anaerolineaceae bacterium]|jgi:carboxypeptidase Taq|nr:carboxypeptidase M32 [Anaerolineaceae bacterium]NMD32261.1 carboxypeptidase M32 [Chloroflexota bacterium]HNS63977.1 carboxypeptidase M32 [Anaerolineaceae bacterium]HNY99708.1 carboxypeptidase M32 [Anaerolineaceae bacterium]HOD44970.1 carboxypeptidase M32 [Anaerolineaceae bacterium]